MHPASLIISSRNRPALLRDAVAAVLAGDAVPAEIVVVDQSDSRNQDLERLAAEHSAIVRYLWTRDRGTSRGRNAAIRAATQSMLLFIDDDCLVDRAWLGTITSALADGGERTVVTGAVAAGAGEIAGAFIPSTIASAASLDYAGRIGEDVLFSNNMALYRRAFEEVGLFDERLGPGARFSAAEDNDLGFRLLEAGYRIRYVPGAIVTHRGWRGRPAYLPLRWAYGRGQGAYYMKHIVRGDREMARRFRASIWDHARRLRWAVRDPLVAAGNLLYVVAMIAAALEWRVTQPRAVATEPIVNAAGSR